MNLTGKQLKELGIITNVPEHCVAQHGIDLELIHVERLKYDDLGFIPRDPTMRTTICKRTIINPTKVSRLNALNEYEDRDVWQLDAGVYDITLRQGCNVPADQSLKIRQRSSLLRNGAIIHSSIFDAGFKTDKIGTILIVSHPIIIEFMARVGQIYSSVSNEVENLYDGQFQNDKQRK